MAQEDTAGHGRSSTSQAPRASPTTRRLERISGTLPWEDVEQRLATARNYWIGTTRPDGRPHAVPLWAVWLDGQLYLVTEPDSQKARNLAANPAIVVHLESGDDVVILDGVAQRATGLDLETFARIADAFAAKYDYRPERSEGIYAIQPATVRAWSLEPNTMTRFRFGRG